MTDSGMWGDSLINRLEKHIWGQKSQFDVVSKKLVTIKPEEPKLFNICRACILSVIPLSQLDEVPSLLPLPSLISTNNLKLKFEDFRVNPLKVQPENLLINCYMADYIHSGQEVTLKVQNRNFKTCLVAKEGSPNFLTMFEDQGLLCSVFDPVISLEDILSALRRAKMTLTGNLAWKIVEAIALYIMSNSQAHRHLLHVTMVKVTKLYGKVYIESYSTTINQIMIKPPELESGFFHTEKTVIWFLGCILREMLPVTEPAQKKVLESLMCQCLQSDATCRPSVESILAQVNQYKREKFNCSSQAVSQKAGVGHQKSPMQGKQ